MKKEDGQLSTLVAIVLIVLVFLFPILFFPQNFDLTQFWCSFILESCTVISEKKKLKSINFILLKKLHTGQLEWVTN